MMRSRVVIPELMDADNLDASSHRQALDGLRRVNRISRTSSIIARTIQKWAESHHKTSGSILDLGCGSGDITWDVAERMSRQGLWKAQGWDMSPTAVDYADRSFCRSRSHVSTASRLRESVSFHCRDVFAETDERFDIVFCSLFLHHFADVDAERVIRRMRSLATGLLIIDDLDRTTWGYLVAWLGVRILSRSAIVHFDGPQSVRAAFTVAEAESLAARAGLSNVSLQHHWPSRWHLTAELSA